ncbi:hypothetical protein TNCV_533941 [Trichonephila clavipes]|nr:hypothetical protein TNCV_533941 [Trichonephila clavipes]
MSLSSGITTDPARGRCVLSSSPSFTEEPLCRGADARSICHNSKSSVAKNPRVAEQRDANVHSPERPAKCRGCRLTTGDDFFGLYLIWLADEACPLCGRDKMDGDPLLQCTGLDEYPTDVVVRRYWEARCQMGMKTSTGVG